jgi:hypothetical protein
MTNLIDTATLDPVACRFESCTAFEPADDASPVCTCGWLDADHLDHPDLVGLAPVLPVRGRRPRVKLPERRAS